MAEQFHLPDLGEGVHEGQIIKLLVPEGAAIVEDQPLMEVETDKAAVEIPSPFVGTVSKWHVEEGQVVNVGDVMVTVDTAGTGSTAPARATAAAGGTATAAPPARRTAPRRGPRKPASPAVRKLARTLGLDLETITGSGPGGRVTRADVQAAATAPAAPAPATRAVVPPPPPSPRPHTTPERVGTPGQDAHGPIRTQPLTQARKTIAANMARAWSTIPHVTDADDADVTDLDALRRGYPAAENGERRITMLAFVIRAVARALQLHPAFNAAFDEANEQIVYKDYINIAVGVHTDRGLVAPVIRNTDQLGVLQIADALDELVAKARTASFAIEDTRGGTYTISNAGAFGGSHYSTPIVTPGQCAVLALGRSRRMPWVVDAAIMPRLIMPLSHSFDHRVADGGEEIAFLRCVIDALEHPARLLL